MTEGGPVTQDGARRDNGAERPFSLLPSHETALALDQSVDRFQAARVLCIGDVMLDRFIYGQIDRISPEAPIPVFAIRDEQLMLGGAGNVARNISALGAELAFIGVIGTDKTGRDVVSMLGAEPRSTPYLITETGRVTTLKTRYVAGAQQVMRADREVLTPIRDDTRRRILEAAESEIAAHDILLLSDYGKGVLTPDTLKSLIALAEKHGRPVIIDPKSTDFSRYYGAFCLSPNLHELALAAGRDVKTDAEIVSAARRLMEAHAIRNMLVTRSSRGMTLISQEGDPCHIPARAQEVTDVSGAGDTVIATLALGLAVGLPLPHAALLANVAAGIVVGRVGTAVASARDVKTALFAEERTGGAHKILPLAQAALHVADWKRDGKRIGFTNGCFDLMHSGHLTLLHRARQACDRLVVAVNSDASVKRLKGEKRPVNGEIERALMLASLSAVDMVVIFGEDTPLDCIRALMPDMLIKGADYARHQVVGHEIVEAAGGEILLVPLKAGYSTTGLIEKMA